jgi:acyl carrier protein
MSDSIPQRVFALIAKQAKVDPKEVTPESTMASLDIPSLGAVELIFDIEDEFDIHFPESDGADFSAETAQSLVDTVQKVLAEKDAGSGAGA